MYEPYLIQRRRQGNGHQFMILIKEALEHKEVVTIPVMDENHANQFRKRLAQYEIKCEITEFWDPTKEGLSSRGHMHGVYDELTGEYYPNKPEPPRIRSLTLKPITNG
jgi:hypothetical protein